MTAIPRRVIAVVDARADGRCELGEDCIAPESNWFIHHHRQAKGMGGSRRRDTVENIIRIHNDCHLRVHAEPDWAADLGYIVSQYAETP